MKNFKTEWKMFKSRFSVITILLLIIISFALTGAATLKWKPLPFENPGSKRMVKASSGNYYFFRSLPEETLMLKVKDLSAIEIRAIAKAKVSNPELTLYFDNKHTTYKLKLLAVSEKYQVFEPLNIALPAGLTQAELLCYDRNIYFRAFMPVQVVPKKPKVPSLKIIAKAGEYTITGAKSSHTYYSFTESTAFTYQVKQGLPHTLYVRAELTKKEKPVFGLYEDGKLIRKYELALKRTNNYKSEGITNLTIGKKLDFPASDKLKNYELKALSENLFLARPVIRKVR
jgi:hypothetical protein